MNYYGSKTEWFIGIIKEIGSSPSLVKVRIFSKHPMDDVESISDGDLPWALVMFPTTGAMRHNLNVEDWVFGFFSDPGDYSNPIVVGLFKPDRAGGGQIGNLSPGVEFNQNPQSNNPIQPQENTPITPVAAGQRPQVAYNFFYEKLSSVNITGDRLRIQVSAIIGNLITESGPSLNPDARNPTSSAYGIAQWTYAGDRRGRLERFQEATARGASQPFQKQLNFIWYEFQTLENRSFRQLIAATNLSDATAAMVAYERDESWQRIGNSNSYAPNRTHRVFLKKLRDSQQVYATFNYTGGAQS